MTLQSWPGTPTQKKDATKTAMTEKKMGGLWQWPHFFVDAVIAYYSEISSSYLFLFFVGSVTRGLRSIKMPFDIF